MPKFKFIFDFAAASLSYNRFFFPDDPAPARRPIPPSFRPLPPIPRLIAGAALGLPAFYIFNLKFSVEGVFMLVGELSDLTPGEISSSIGPFALLSLWNGKLIVGPYLFDFLLESFTLL